MLAYLLLAGRDGAPVDEALIHRFDLDTPPEVPFHPDQRIVWRSPDGSRVFFGWQAFTEVAGIRSHWLVDDRGLTAFSGCCWPAGAGWNHGSGQSWASQLHAWLERKHDLPELRDELFGHFTVISLPSQGTGWLLPDFGSVDQLFTADGDRFTAVSNRAGLCATAISRPSAIPERSLMGAGWLVCDGWILDEESGYWNVHRPLTGGYVVVEPGGVRVIEPARPSFLLPKPGDASVSYDMLLDEVDRDVRSSIRAMADLPLDERVVALSGGKDSRTLTAIIIDEGLHDRFRFVTYGSPERADVLAARQLAHRFGLDWQMIDASDRSPEAELDSLRGHAALREGMNSGWSTMEPPVFEPGISVFGVLGEALRWGPVSMTGIDASDVDDLIQRIDRKRPLDRLGILRSECRSYYRNERAHLIRRLAVHGEPMQTVSTLAYHEGLVRGRNGPDTAWSPRLRLNPFLTPVCMRANHRLPAAQRPDIRFHLDLQRRCDRSLSMLPLADAVWSEASYAHLPDATDYRRMQPLYSSSPAGRTWRLKRYADYQPLMERYLLDRDNPIHAIVDEQRLIERIGMGDANAGRTRLIWNALTAAIWMGGHERPVRLARSQNG